MGPALDLAAWHALRGKPWAELLRLTLAIRQLDHPADAVYMLIPEDTAVSTSRRAWCVARTMDPIPPAGLVIQAVRLLLPFSAFEVNEWLDRPDLNMATVAEWKQFAHECAANHRFTDEWHAAHGPGHMGETILAKAADELRSLEGTLLDRERARMLQVRKQRPRLSFADEQAVKFEAERQVSVRARVLEEAGGILESMPAAIMEERLDLVADLVSALCGDYPELQWSLRLRLHRAAIDTLGLSVWHVERRLRPCRHPHPLSALGRL